MKCEGNKMDEKKRKDFEKLNSEIVEGTAGNDKDWSTEIQHCQPGSVYYNKIYGKMEVVAIEDDYIYLRILDKKGCAPDFLEKNNILVEIDGMDEEAKEFSLSSIGRWLFPEMKDVDTSNASNVHRIFK